MKKSGKRSLGKAIALYSLIAVLVIALGIGNYFAQVYSSLVTIYLGQNDSTNQTELDENAVYFSSEFSSNDDLVSAEEALAKEIQTQGSVLLTNNGVLPLSSSAKVTVLGMRSINSVYQDSGSASAERDKCRTIYDSLRDAGFQVNTATEEFYNSSACANYFLNADGANADLNKGNAEVREVPVSLYTDSVTSSFAAYNDAAIIMLSRIGGEGGDLDIINGYLELSQEEKDLIDLADANFDQVVVIVNTAHAITLGHLEDKVDAILWMGLPGDYGMDVLGQIIAGTSNPSGKLVDTYAYSSKSAPASVNFGVDTDVNGWNGKKSVVYQEGIYVGYRYYETRYTDCVTDRGGADAAVGSIDGEGWSYAKEVQFPFGFGLSYTTFDVSLYPNYTENDGNLVFTGTVKNTGPIDGMETIQLYLQKPYTQYDIDNSIEKSAVELVGYTKVGVSAGGSADFTITVPVEELKTYDANNAGTYILEDGDYWFAVGNGAHEAANNILAAQGFTTENGMDQEGNPANTIKYTQSSFDGTTYAVSLATGVAIENQLGIAELRNYVDDITYLSRNDWAGTYPTELYVITATDKMKEDAEYRFDDDPSIPMPVSGTVTADHSLSLIELRGKSYDDPMWDDLLNQLEVKQMFSLISKAGFQTNAIESISKPQTREQDGPYGISGALIGADIRATIYPDGDVRSATFNDELIERMGVLVGEDGLLAGITGWYAPGCNIHRSPYGGRTSEYYSEDSFLSGKMAAATIRGAQSKGLITICKHFALNEQETNRMGILTFADEQTIREIYLKPFEIAVREGHTHAIMSSYNNVGLKWSSGVYGLATTILRGEWGFDGFVLTDLGGGTGMLLDGLAGGTDAWLSTNTQDAGTVMPGYSKSAAQVNLLRESTKRILYAQVNFGLCMNGYSAATEVKSALPMWQICLYIVDAVVAIAAVAGVFLITKKVLPNKGEKQAKQ